MRAHTPEKGRGKEEEGRRRGMREGRKKKKKRRRKNLRVAFVATGTKPGVSVVKRR